MSTSFTEITEARYDEQLGILPPACMTAYGFLVGEPFDHRKCTITSDVRPTYAAYICHHGKFYKGPSLTVPEFRKLDLDIALPR